MSAQKAKSHVPKSTVSAATNTASRSNVTERTHQLVQNYLLIWVDGNIDPKNEDCENTLNQLRGVVRKVEHCTTAAECIEFLNKMDDEKAFIIASGAVGQNMVPDIHGMAQVRAIYIFCGNKARHEAWASKWPKVQGVYTAIQPICASLKEVTRECDHDTISMSFVPKRKTVGATSSEDNLDELPPSFMYSTLFKEIILEINEDDDKSISDLVAYCLKKNIPEKELKDFQAKYHRKSAIWWYSCENFLYPMLNYALRILDMETMTKMIFFIRRLHLQLQELHKQQLGTYNKRFFVYRGQGLSREDFQQLLDSKGGLLSFNNFLSTSTEPKKAMEFLDRSLAKYKENVGIFFIITIDPRKVSASTNTPFAFVDDYSAMEIKENEILFSMHTVFRVDNIEQTPTNTRRWEVQLTLTDDNDPQLAGLMNCMKEELCGSTGLHRLGDLMKKVGHFNQAEELYNQLLEKASSDNDRAFIYYQLGWLKDDQGEYNEAVAFYERSLKIRRRTLPEDDPSLSPTYNNIALVYNNMGEYSKALEFYEKDLVITKKALPPNHPDLATSYSNIGLVYNNMGEYSKALEFYEKSQKIYEKALPPNHPSLATSYSNIGQVYNNMGEYSKALEFYEKDLVITRKALPPNHPSLAISYGNIGQVYNNMGEYSKALEFYEKSHQIREKALPPNHPELATSYNNIGSVYNNMGEYSKALEFYEKDLVITKKALPPNHPSLAGSHLSFAACYEKMGDYTGALKALENAFKIKQKTFEEGNQAFSSTYSWFGRVYRSMKEYSKALDYFQKCLAIVQKTLPEKHPNLGITYSNIGDVHRLMGDYEKALSFHQKALNIQENVRCNPLDSATTYVNLGETYREMKDYQMALTYYQKGMEIREKKLPKNHCDLAVIYHNLAKLYLATRQYNMAMKNVQQALEIAQEKLPRNHPHLVDYRETFEKIRKKL